MYLHIPAVNPHVRMIVRSISTLLLFYTLRSPTFPVRPAQEIGGLRDTPKSLNWWDFLCVYKSIYVLILCKYYTYIYIHIHPKVRNSMWSLKRSLGFSAVGLKFRPSNCGHIQQNLVVHRVTKPTYLSKGGPPCMGLSENYVDIPTMFENHDLMARYNKEQRYHRTPPKRYEEFWAVFYVVATSQIHGFRLSCLSFIRYYPLVI
jgi:hypothetical protein